MLDAAFKFRMTEPWNKLKESDIFAVKLSDDTIVYCSIMGNGGLHHALGIYIGSEGFSTYLNSLYSGGMNQAELWSISTEFGCINCDFMQAKEIEEQVKKAIRNYAERNDIKIPRKNGWIDFTRHSPYKVQWNITDPHDAFVAEETLRAATFFVNEFQEKSFSDVNLDPMGKRSTLTGGKPIPFITSNADGSYDISTTKTPPFVEREYIALPLTTTN